MIPLNTPQQARELDKFAITKLGIPGSLLMESAANNLFNIFHEIYPVSEYSNVLIVCGKGNNAGDGICLGRLLVCAGYDVTLLLAYTPDLFSGDALQQYTIFKNLSLISKQAVIKFLPAKKFNFTGYDVIVDALLGSGSKLPLDSKMSKLVAEINLSSVEKFAIDAPTGVDSESGYSEDVAFKADVTVSLGNLKQGLFFSNGYVNSGAVYFAGIGIPDDIVGYGLSSVYLIEPHDVNVLLPKKRKDIHKYSAGKVLSVCGSVEYPGAGLLCSAAAFRVGAGSSVLAFPKSLQKFAHTSKNASLVVRKYDDSRLGHLRAINLNELKDDLLKSDVVLTGCGLGSNADTKDAVNKMIQENPSKKIVVDADALNSIVWKNNSKKYTNCIFTPHLGEFSKMLGLDTSEIRKNILNYGKKFSSKHNCVLVLKDYRSLIFSPTGEVFICPVGNSGLAKLGSGDVLSGMIAGIYSQIKKPLEAAICAVYLHGLAADILQETHSTLGYTSTDLVDQIPFTIKFLENSCA